LIDINGFDSSGALYVVVVVVVVVEIII